MPAFAEDKNVMCYLNDIYVYLRARSPGLRSRVDGRRSTLRQAGQRSAEAEDEVHGRRLTTMADSRQSSVAVRDSLR